MSRDITPFFIFIAKKIPEKRHLAGVVEVHFSHLGVIFILGLRVGDISNIALIAIFHLEGNKASLFSDESAQRAADAEDGEA